MIAKVRLDATNDVSKVKDWINQAYFEASVLTESKIASTTMTLTAGTATYTLSSSIARIKEMYVTPTAGSQSGPLQQTTLDYILRRRQAGGGVGVSVGYVTHYALLGASDFEVWPTPTDASVLTIWAVQRPTALSADSDTPEIEEPFASKLLEYGAAAEAADWKGDPSEIEYRQLFEQWMQRYRSHLTRKMGGQPGQFRLLPGYQFPPHDPSVDVVNYGGSF